MYGFETCDNYGTKLDELKMMHFTSESGPLSKPGQLKATNSVHLLCIVNRQTLH